MLDKYIDDLVYITNTGGDGVTLTIRGKENLRLRFKTAMETVHTQIRLESIRLERGLVRTRMNVIYDHKPTGHSLNCSLRQILRFQEFRIAEQQDFHDAAKLAAFWRLVGDPLRRLQRPEPT